MGHSCGHSKMNTLVVLTLLTSSALAKDLYLGKHKARLSDSKATNQFMDCYDYANQGGDRLRAIDYMPDLSGYNFDNKISYCCITGVWILYADRDYNTNNLGSANWWVYGDNYCTNVPNGFDNQASSLRYTGAPDAWTADTLNLYLNDFFIGGEEYTYADLPQLNYNDQTKSIIVTGCSGWTLYTDSNYKGSCKCVWPSDTNKCFPGFYKDQQSLGFMANSISSTRRGCFCGTSIYPDNHDTQSLDGGASGFFPGRN